MNKKALIAMIHHVGNLKLNNDDASIELNNQGLVLLTAAGQIIGTPCQPDDKESANTKERILDSVFSEAGNAYTEATNENDFILLKNATLMTSSGQNISYGYLYVFTDDIIAASVTDPHSN